ncbi:MAG: hypothetical protein RLZZ215_1917 [Pseudomonadota bacterium]|jgi:hypothetical protein
MTKKFKDSSVKNTKPNQYGSSTNKKKPARKPTKKPTIDLKAKGLNDRLNAFPGWLNFQSLAIGIDKNLFKPVNVYWEVSVKMNHGMQSGGKRIGNKVL